MFPCTKLKFLSLVGWSFGMQLTIFDYLKMETASSSETMITNYKWTRHHIPEDSNFHQQNPQIMYWNILYIYFILALVKLYWKYEIWKTACFSQQQLLFDTRHLGPYHPKHIPIIRNQTGIHNQVSYVFNYIICASLTSI